MRILQLLNHTRRLNGHVHAAVDLACAQAKLGHQVAVASSGGDFDPLLASSNVEIMQVCIERRPKKLVDGASLLYRLVRDWRADIVHAHMMTSAVLAWPICKLLKIPLVTTVHNEFERSAILMGLGARVIAVSAAVGTSMRKRGVPESRIRVVLNGTIGAARLEKQDRSPASLQSPAVVFVGGLHPRKGLADLFSAFEAVHRVIPTAHLYIVGDGPHRAEYLTQVSSMACAEAVTFMGAQDNPFPFLLGADVFVLPSHADPAPLVLSEAREAGCAIVASNVDGIPEMLDGGRAGILVPTGDPAGLAVVLRSLLEDKQAVLEWKKNSQINLDFLTIDRVARETLQIYEEASRHVHGRA
ncbi:MULTISPECIES: glycosyltransferase family 4 protein [unclassified Bradyrhizobium]|uniref:glycosyltransferase family 4 protein n=1 Tax=unclassified Bradyrhizobium TaxID=2631580 RepID=UPI0024B0C87F|nr:glycosyltransferase family 4 protein [Bradyrhizobium sp. CB2312]WFU69224.1 glycosyltransferase family 4 protein [Bradyrhizobium sp. CB2312]